MPRKPRIHFPGAFYHVMLRGNNKQKIFFSNADRNYFIYLLREGIKNYSHRVHAFCLMDNHIHLAIEVNDTPISKILHNLSFRYTQYINKSQSKVGHLFQGRFKAILIDVDEYLLALIRYIHLNPVKANIVDTPEKYVWSSHRAYLLREKICWLTTEFVLCIFNKDMKKAIFDYGKFIHEPQNEEVESLHKKFSSGNQKNHSVLCGGKFLHSINKFIQPVTSPKINLETILKIICRRYSIEAHQLKSSNKKLYVKLRGFACIVVKKFKICSMAEIGKVFQRDPTGSGLTFRLFY